MKFKILKSTIYLGLIISTAFFMMGGSILPQTDEAPYKTAKLEEHQETIQILPERLIMPGGNSVGVKMNVKGVLVVGLEEIEGKNGVKINPGLKAGLQIGDSILEVNEVPVQNAAEVTQEINKINENSEKVLLKVKRKNDIISVNIIPIMSIKDQKYKIGVWVKDKTAGIGTLTYFDPQNNAFGALGHAITNPETGTVLPVAEGELLKAKVQSVKQGKAGMPGEIKGIFYEADEPIGKLNKNTVFGIFGTTSYEMTNPYFNKPIPIAGQQEIERGSAYILTTLDGNKIEKFDILIEKINYQTKADTKGLVIKVVDPRLLEKSGGIVQGMSGSPIIQNNKLIGAVTHVFVNDPQKGYGVFIEWMLNESDVD